MKTATKGMNFFEIRRRWRTIVDSARPSEAKIAVLSTFTADLLVPCLGVALEDAGIPSQVWTGPYNQIVQECLDQEGHTTRFAPDWVVVCPRLEELWSGLPLPWDGGCDYHRDALQLADACCDAAQRWSAGLVFVLPPVPEAQPLGLGDAGNRCGVAASATAVREALRQRLAGLPRVLIVDLEALIRRLGSVHAYKPAMLVYAHIPFSDELFMALGARIARLIRLARDGGRRVLVADADDTLWGGRLGEVGADGIELVDRGRGLAHRDFQAYLLDCAGAGLRLALMSPAPPAEVARALARPEMRLGRSHFAAVVAGSQGAAAKLEAVAEELEVGLEAMALLTASEDLSSEVGRTLPQVARLIMPDDAADWLRAVQESHLLDSLPPQPESAPPPDPGTETPLSLERFLASLRLEVNFVELGPDHAQRAVEMQEEIPEFNLAAVSRTPAEVADQLRRRSARIWEIRVRDRFDDYGTAGLCRSSVAGETLEVDTMVLNCRVFGKRVEACVVRELTATAEEEQLSGLRFRYRPTPRNQPALDFLKAIDGEGLREWEDGWELELPVAQAAEWARRRLSALDETILPGDMR